jgi:hypothetical protein
MMRHCDGTDPNLTRQVPYEDFDGEAMVINTTWKMIAQPGHIVINCQCGRYFDDATCTVLYPHALLPPKLTGEQLQALHNELAYSPAPGTSGAYGIPQYLVPCACRGGERVHGVPDGPCAPGQGCRA